MDHVYPVDKSKAFYFQWHFIDSCNLRCVHCYQKGYDVQDLAKNKIMRIAQILDKTLFKWGKSGRISLTGGEPFINKDLLIDLLNYFEQTNNFYWVGILTNGTLLDIDIVKKLTKYKKLKEIQVSLDGSSQIVHDKIRGEGSFNKAIKGIKLLKKYGLSVSIMFTLHKINKAEALSIIELADTLGVDAITVERVTPTTAGDVEKIYIQPEELHTIYNCIYQKKLELEKRSSLKIRISRPLWSLIDETLGGFCPVGLTSLCILHDGTVLPCRRLEIPLGNILEDGLFKIWYTSKILWRIRNKTLLGSKCRDCSLLGNCGGCRAIAYSVSGDYMDNDPQCWK